MTNELYHHGILGMKWGVRRYQNSDGTLTEAGRKRYYNSDGSFTNAGKKRLYKAANRYIGETGGKAASLYREINDNEYIKKQASRLDADFISMRKAYKDYRDNPNSDEARSSYIKTYHDYNDLTHRIVKEMLGKYSHEKVNDAALTRGGTLIQDALHSQATENFRNRDKIKKGSLDRAKKTNEYNIDFLETVQNDPVLQKGGKELLKEYSKYLDDPNKYMREFDKSDYYKKNRSVKHDDEDSSELYHHGVLGMKWGVRRYQNEDGSLTSAGKKRYGSFPQNVFAARRRKKKQAEALEKRRATIQAKKDAEEEAKRHEEEKRNAITSGKASDIAKFQNELSNQELQDALRRLDLKRQLNNLSEAEKPKVKTAMDRVEEAMKTAKRASDIAENGVKAYNTFAKINNTFTKGKKLPIIKDANNKDDKNDDNENNNNGNNNNKGNKGNNNNGGSSNPNKPKGPQNSGGGSSAAADLAKMLKESKARTDRYLDDSERGFREDRVNTDKAWLKQRRAESDAFYEYMDKQAARLLDESANRAYAKRAAALSRSGSKWYEQVDRSAMESSASSLAAALNASRERIDELERNRR